MVETTLHSPRPLGKVWPVPHQTCSRPREAWCWPIGLDARHAAVACSGRRYDRIVPPISYAVDGKQFVAIATGGVLYSFGLPESGQRFTAKVPFPDAWELLA